MTRNPPAPDLGERTKAKPPAEPKLDKEIEDWFPASDPPSHAGGKHRSGAPRKPQPPRAEG